MLVSNPPLGIDEKALGDSPHAIVDSDLTRIVPAVRVCHVEFFEERARIFFSILERDTEEDHVLVFVSLPGGFEIFGFRAAGHTPGRPKVQKDGFAAQFLESDLSSIEEG